MIAIGITGSFASGKSFVLNYLSSMKFHIFSADEFVKNLYKDQFIQQQILNLIPELKVFDKIEIAKLIYHNEKIRERLQNFIHPLVIEALLAFKQQNKDDLLLFAEIPLLFESHFECYFDLIVTTFCSEQSRLERAKMRVNFDQQIYDHIETIQLPQDYKIKKANFVINTDINLIELESQIRKLIQKCHEYARNNNRY